MSEDLYIILPYFNFLNYKSGIKNLELFVQNFKDYNNVKIVLVEAVYKPELQLENYSNQLYKHIKVKAEHILWIKENLINIGIKHLPEDWKYVGWIDRDIQFKNPNWANHCIEELQHSDLIQPWKECLFLDEQGQIKVEEYFNKGSLVNKKILSHCYISCSSNPEEPHFKHAGHAWCCTRNFYNKIGMLCDKAIVGGGDGLIVIAIEQKHKHPHYRYLGSVLEDYCNKLEGTKIGYINETIYHNHHGSIENRNYLKRYDDLYTLDYTPWEHLTYNQDGVLKFTENGRILEEFVELYLLSRNEDENI